MHPKTSFSLLLFSSPLFTAPLPFSSNAGGPNAGGRFLSLSLSLRELLCFFFNRFFPLERCKASGFATG